jgi:tetratricopeptide (TPR) repeat protein
MGRYGIDWSKGLENFTDEDYDRIFKETSKIIESKSPEDLLPGAYYDRGIIYRNRGDNEKAVLDYTSAIQLNCRHIDAAYYNRGFVYYVMDQYDAALADFDVYRRLKPNEQNDETLKNAIAWMLDHK